MYAPRAFALSACLRDWLAEVLQALALVRAQIDIESESVL